MQVVGAVGFNKQRLELPSDVQPEVAQLIADCWSEVSAQRPSFAEVLERLAKLPCLTPTLTKIATADRDD